jgi:MFS family permease
LEIIRNANPGKSDPGDTLHNALKLAFLFATIKLAIHIAVNLWQAHLGWGYFRDELYYILCGQHLDWGYVDHGPIVALQARLAILLFGKSLAGIRMFSALAGAAKVFLTGLLAWQMGATRPGQALAMAGVLLAPQYLGADSYLSMNSFEPVFWMTCALAVLLLLNGGNAKWWMVFGLSAGIGLENKPSMLVFLLALLAGLLLTPERRVLASRMVVLGVAIAALLALPNLFWQIHHHWPTLEFLHNGKAEHKNITLSFPAFLHAQELMLSPASLPLWGTGLVWLLIRPRAAHFRFFGFTFLIFVVLMFATRDAKDYYLAPIYPFLFAAGGCAWQTLLRSKRTYWIFPAYSAFLVVTAIVILPMALPILTPEQWLAYADRLHLRDKSSQTENTANGPLPQFYADRFGWQELTDSVTRIYNALPAGDKAKAGIICTNYGEASAINFLGAGRGLPFAISGQNNYYLWGPHGETGEVMIVINGATPEEMRENYDSVEIAGVMDHPYAMPYEHRNIYLCRARKGSLITDWPNLKRYI